MEYYFFPHWHLLRSLGEKDYIWNHCDYSVSAQGGKTSYYHDHRPSLGFTPTRASHIEAHVSRPILTGLPVFCENQPI